MRRIFVYSRCLRPARARAAGKRLDRPCSPSLTIEGRGFLPSGRQNPRPSIVQAADLLLPRVAVRSRPTPRSLFRPRVGGLLLSCLSLLTATPARAEAQAVSLGSVRGTVLEADSDRPVRSATVSLVAVPPGAQEALSGATRRSVLTDDGGRYAFVGVAAGRYRIDVSGLGYRQARVWISLPRDWAVRRSVALEVDPVALEPISISLRPSVPRVAPDLAPVGIRVRAPKAATVGESLELATLDARVLDPSRLPGVGTLGEPDVFRALQRLPGVSARGDFSDNLWTRGAPWGMTQILLDGLPLFDPLHVGGIAAGLAADGLESIVLLPGVRPPSAAEGAAGTIALTTRPAAQKRRASVAVSSMAVRTRLEDRFLDGRIGLAVTARRSWWDLISPPPIFRAQPSHRGVDYNFADAAGRLDAKIGTLATLEAGGLWEEDHLDGNIAGLVSMSEGRWGNRLGWVKLRRSLRGIRMETMLGAVEYRVVTRPKPWSAFFGPDGVPSLEHIETAIGHSTVGLSLGGSQASGRFTWETGFRTVRERLSQVGADAWDRGLQGVDAPAVLRRTHGWAEAALRIASVDLAGGLGLDRTSGRGSRPPILPTLRVRWEPLGWLTLEVADGAAIQFIYPLAPAGTSLGPSLGTGYSWIMAVDGTPPLVSHIATAGALVSLAGGVSVNVAAWRRRVGGLWLPGVSALDSGRVWQVATEEGGGHERGRGIEARVGWRNERASVDASYSVERSRYSDENGLAWPSPAKRRRSFDLHAMARATDALTVGVDYTAETGWPLVLGPAAACGEDAVGCVDLPYEQQPREYAFAEAPPFASLDLAVEWRHAWGWGDLGVTGSLQNVLGHANAAAFRAETCDGAELVSSVCEVARGVPRFSSGYTRPTPSLALKLSF